MPAKTHATIVVLLALAAFGASAQRPPTGSAPVSMDATAWTIRYSPGMPAHPSAGEGGWYFDFPTGRARHVDYVTTDIRMAAPTNISASIAVSTVGTAVFGYRTAADNSCNLPAHVRLFLQERGDDLSGDGPMQYYRWWQNEGAFELAPGEALLSASLTDPPQWTSVFGRKGNADAAAVAGFRQAVANIGEVGFTFGGGCFYGHGIYVEKGAARFIVAGYLVQ